MPGVPLIAIVDDDDSLRKSLDNLLRSVGFRTQGFSSAEAFLSSNHIPDTTCLILDVRMPGMSGIEVCRRLRAENSAPGARVVLITGTPDPVLSAQAAEAGAVALLGKETPPGTIAAQLLAAADGRVGWSVE